MPNEATQTYTSKPFPLELQVLDHYTLIVEDAAAVAKFHEEVLGFTPLRIQQVNAGSVPDGEYDMLNHVLQIPGTSRRVLVVTEGLTEDSIFRRYMRENGQGVHHLAYEVDDLDASFAALHNSGIKTTSEEILTDPLTGLRQVFIHREHCGYFLELIERTEAADTGVFTNKNMAALAKTMIQYLQTEDRPADSPSNAPRTTIHRARAEVIDFLLAPGNLVQWTGHRTVREINGEWVEVRMVGDIPLSITELPNSDSSSTVRFRWSAEGSFLDVCIDVSDKSNATEVTAQLDSVPPDRLERTYHMIQTELDILAALLENRPSDIRPEQTALIDDYHLEVYQRRNL